MKQFEISKNMLDYAIRFDQSNHEKGINVHLSNIYKDENIRIDYRLKVCDDNKIISWFFIIANIKADSYTMYSRSFYSRDIQYNGIIDDFFIFNDMKLRDSEDLIVDYLSKLYKEDYYFNGIIVIEK